MLLLKVNIQLKTGGHRPAFLFATIFHYLRYSYMVVLPTDALQVIRITPRAGNILFFDIYDELTKETTVINSFSITEQSHYYNVLLSYMFIEGRNYTIKARGTNDAIRYYGKLFCTAQEPETYKILNDSFTQKESDNTFITL